MNARFRRYCPRLQQSSESLFSSMCLRGCGGGGGEQQQESPEGGFRYIMNSHFPYNYYTTLLLEGKESIIMAGLKEL